MTGYLNSRRWEHRRREALIRSFASREVGTRVVLNQLTVKQVARIIPSVSDEEVANYALLLQGFARVGEAAR